ncbi:MULTISPECIES: tachylectin-related carbohydrate-binding protein [Actinoalloteichus]|uniref:Tachylectin n=1 Tax=Actinoalloteichus fjordicus TaxID=1612552 RepID=A0AAC9LF49_9PSEU|nr:MULTISPECIES: tachylectin-related carbohydrate-binding protein [Actinoalloteichus]APU15632.1 Tachylectin [Actinoalloteichus fjordicus]APU21692.1 Tachylectin [Actinoalloteichus sp. GBA129-24]
MRERRSSRMSVLAVGILAMSLLAGLPALAASPATEEEPILECHTFARFYTADPNGDVYHSAHSDPIGGATRWNVAVGAIGNSVDGRMLAGPAGLLYEIKSDGLLQMYRRGDSGWEQWEDGGFSRDFQTTLGGYTSTAWRNRITVDSTGDFYFIRGNNQLYRATLDDETRELRQQSIDADWSRFDLITAAGPGVLYARESDGTLYRYQYDAATEQWTDQGTWMADGWERFAQAASPGGDVLYAVDTESGQLHWQRFLPYSDDTIESRIVSRSTWTERSIAITSDSCAWTGTSATT